MSLFDHLHDCYVECTQNSADKSSDKVLYQVTSLVIIISLYSHNQYFC